MLASPHPPISPAYPVNVLEPPIRARGRLTGLECHGCSRAAGSSPGRSRWTMLSGDGHVAAHGICSAQPQATRPRPGGCSTVPAPEQTGTAMSPWGGSSVMGGRLGSDKTAVTDNRLRQALGQRSIRRPCTWRPTSNGCRAENQQDLDGGHVHRKPVALHAPS